MNAAPVERRADGERIAALEARVEGLTGWVESLSDDVKKLSASFNIGSTKLDEILRRLDESAVERREQTRKIEEQSALLTAHTQREEHQLDALHNEIVEAETRQTQRLREANTDSVNDRKNIWDAIKHFHGADSQPKVEPAKEPHWMDKLLAIVRDNLLGFVGKALALVLLGYLILGFQDMSAALKAVKAQVETVVPR